MEKSDRDKKYDQAKLLEELIFHIKSSLEKINPFLESVKSAYSFLKIKEDKIDTLNPGDLDKIVF